MRYGIFFKAKRNETICEISEAMRYEMKRNLKMFRQIDTKSEFTQYFSKRNEIFEKVSWNFAVISTVSHIKPDIGFVFGKLKS